MIVAHVMTIIPGMRFILNTLVSSLLILRSRSWITSTGAGMHLEKSREIIALILAVVGGLLFG